MLPLIRVPPDKVATAALAPADARWNQCEVSVLLAASSRLTSTLPDLSKSSSTQLTLESLSLSGSSLIQDSLSWSRLVQSHFSVSRLAVRRLVKILISSTVRFSRTGQGQLH